MLHLSLNDLKVMPESIMLVDREEAGDGSGNYNAVETFNVEVYRYCEICEIRNRGGYHTVYVYAP